MTFHDFHYPRVIDKHSLKVARGFGQKRAPDWEVWEAAGAFPSVRLMTNQMEMVAVVPTPVRDGPKSDQWDSLTSQMHRPPTPFRPAVIKATMRRDCVLKPHQQTQVDAATTRDAFSYRHNTLLCAASFHKQCTHLR